MIEFKHSSRKSLVVQWLGCGAFTAEDPDSISGWETKILQAMWLCQSKQTSPPHK